MESGVAGLTGRPAQWPVAEGPRRGQGHVLILLLLMEARSVRERTSARETAIPTAQKVFIISLLPDIHQDLMFKLKLT